ncbi:MAG: KamA family radical SAM protein [Planctomycetia bacterium]|nr:KamA family radical SAM protein [Planctomycetia bacterium]
MDHINESVRTDAQSSVQSSEPRYLKLEEVGARLGLPQKAVSEAETAANAFPMLFPDSLVDRVRPGDLNDPVLLQFLPRAEELQITPGFSQDPLCELNVLEETQTPHSSPAIMQKYRGRVLVVTTNRCMARCRFCFRKFFPQSRALYPLVKGRENTNKTNETELLSQAFQSVAQDESIHEIIFSGGDPLTLSNSQVRTLLDYINSLRNVKRVRFHTRAPIITPARIDDDFPSASEFHTSSRTPLALYIVLHINSHRELDQSAVDSITRLRSRGYILLSQTVLLHGVNDSHDALVSLFEALADLGVIPYYLHQLDRVQGAAHFEVPYSKGLELIREISAQLPGYATPRYVQETPNSPMKTPLYPNCPLILQNQTQAE